MELLTGDIVLVKGDYWISQEIEEVENSPYSHCACIVSPNEVIEAGFFKVKYNSLNFYKGEADIYRYKDLSKYERIQIAGYLIDQLGKRYDYKLLIWEWCRYKLNLILPYFNTDSVICSELANDSFRSIGIDLDLPANCQALLVQ